MGVIILPYRIVQKEKLAPGIHLMKLEAPLVARKAKPGQFVMIRIDEKGERIPLTIADWSTEEGTVTIVFLEAGKTTKKMATLNQGDFLENFVGPLGNLTHIKNYGTVVCIGGGVGIALTYPEVRAFKQAGNYVISIIGARNKDLLIFENEIRSLTDEFYITTDDGSKGHHGFVSDILKKLIEEKRKIDLVLAIGPAIMMMVIAKLTKPYGIRTVASLNPIMVDGTGMCGSCRVMVGGETKFTCVDGPEFDAHQIDFEHLMARNQRCLEEEAICLKAWEAECQRAK